MEDVFIIKMKKLLTILMLGMFMISLVYALNYNKEIIINSEEDILNNCKDLDIEKTSYCLRDNIKPIYKYNLSKRVYVTPTFDKLKLNGGDCEDWSVYYSHLGEELGFKSSFINTYGKVPHQWTILTDEKLSCEIDQLKVNCYENKNE